MGGIMDYKARMYSPYINRFLQPDTVIPDLSNPQSWNRFSYVTNNPVRFNDPSGNIYLCTASCEAEAEKKQYTIDDYAAMYGVTFNPSWSVTDKAAAMTGVYKIAKKLQQEMNSAADRAYQSCMENLQGPTSTCSQTEAIGAYDAFKKTYTQGVYLEWGCSDCSRLAFAKSPNHVAFRKFYPDWHPDQLTKNINLVVHELGHVFDYLNSWKSERTGKYYRPATALTPDMTKNRDGFGTQWLYQQSDSTSGVEIFADMFVHWVQGGWTMKNGELTTSANARIDWLNQYMPGYLP